jgi:myosin heavy chain 9/10/11/14
MELTKDAEFIYSILFEIKKVCPDIPFNNLQKDPLDQALQIVRFAVQFLLKEKKSIDIEYSALKNEEIGSLDEIDQIILAKNQLKKAHLKLSNYQKVLKEKEQKLKTQEAELKYFLQGFNEEKKNFEEEKELITLKLRELEIRIKASREKELEIQNKFDQLEIQKQLFSREKSTIMKMKEKMEQTCLETEKIKEINLFQQQKLEQELQKLEIEKEILMEKEENQADKEIELEKIQESILTQRKILEQEKKQFSEEKTKLGSMKLEIEKEKYKMIKESIQLETDKSYIEFTSSYQNANENKKLVPEEIQTLFDKLRTQIDVFNEEITTREFLISEKQRILKEDAQRLAETFEKIQMVQGSLATVKNEILSLFEESLPEIQKIYENSKLMSQELSEHKTLENMIKELAYKLKMMEIRETELEKQYIECYEAKEKIRGKQIKLYKDIETFNEEKEMFEAKSYNLKLGIKNLAAKEAEVKYLKQELDKRAQMLNIKENQIEVKLLQIKNKDF